MKLPLLSLLGVGACLGLVAATKPVLPGGFVQVPAGISPTGGSGTSTSIYSGTAVNGLRMTGTGNFWTGIAANGPPGSLMTGAGNIFIPDMQGIGWMDQTGTVNIAITGWETHSGGRELSFTSTRIAHVADVMQVGYAGTADNKQRYMYFRGATAATTGSMPNSYGLVFTNFVWTGGSSAQQDFAMQVIPANTTGSGGELHFKPYAVETSGTNQITGTSVMILSSTSVKIPNGTQLQTGTGNITTAPAIGFLDNNFANQSGLGISNVSSDEARIYANGGDIAAKWNQGGFYLYNGASVVVDPNSRTLGGGAWTVTTGGVNVTTGSLSASTVVAIGGNIIIGGTAAAPVNAVTPVLWQSAIIGGTAYRIPLYQ